MVRQAEVVFIVQYVQVFYNLFIRQVSSREAYRLVENGKCVTHAAVCLLGNDVQCLRLVCISLFVCHELQVVDDGLYAHAVEIVHLATAQYGRQDFMLFRSGQDKDDIRRRLFQRLEESIECSRGQHVHLVDDEHLIASHLRRYAHLFY